MLGERNGEYVMIEEYVEGKFQKYVNNDGSLSTTHLAQELQAKAECLVHFSFIKSKKTLMMLDIQGCEYTLFDPEIASLQCNVDNGVFCLVWAICQLSLSTFTASL